MPWQETADQIIDTSKQVGLLGIKWHALLRIDEGILIEFPSRVS